MKPRTYDYDEIARLYQRLGTMKAVAAEVGCSVGTVLNAMIATGAPRASKPGPHPNAYPMGIPYRKKKPDGYIRWQFRYWKDGKRRYHEIFEHRVIMAQMIGRPPTDKEQIHHRNGIRDDNRPENLELMDGHHGAGASVCPHCGGSLR